MEDLKDICKKQEQEKPCEHPFHCVHICEYCGVKITHHLQENEACLYESKIVCEANTCELRHTLDIYKIRLEKSEQDKEKAQANPVKRFQMKIKHFSKQVRERSYII